MSLVRHEHRTTWPREWVGELSWPDERVDRAFRDMFRDFFTGGALLDRFFDSAPVSMHLEEFVEDGTCVIRAELPGVDPDKDIEISVADGMVHLRARREERKAEEKPSGYHSEFRYGSFERTVRLPEGATDQDVNASYKDGILEVRIPVPAAPPPSTPTKVAIAHG